MIQTSICLNSIRILLSLLLIFSQIFVNAQNLEAFPVNLKGDSIALSVCVDQLNQQIPATIYSAEDLSDRFLDINVSEMSLSAALEQILYKTGLDYSIYRNSVIIIAPKSAMLTNQTANFYQALQESLETSRESNPVYTVVGSPDQIVASGQTNITGRVTDAEDGYEIIGATLLVEETGTGTVTDEFGYYNLPIKTGNFHISIQYVGYQGIRLPLKVISTGTLDIKLEKASILLDEVIVEARRKDENVTSTQVGVSRISTKEIEKLPALFGEVDIIKGLLIQPGVSNIGEGSSGFNVRGGNVDQNLIMIDEGILFNANHALGFFSSFNTEVVSDAVLYKGIMPANYGGRLASTLDVNVRNGNFNKWHLKGGLGLISSRINVDGPITKEKTSILLAARSTYSDWILKQVKVPEIRGSSAFFYDLNASISHKLNQNDNLTISWYNSNDRFVFNEEFGFDYQTYLGQVQFRKIFGKKTLASTHIVWSKYVSDQEDLAGVDASMYKTGLGYLKLKQDVNYLAEEIQINAGISAIHYTIQGNQVLPTLEQSIIIPAQIDDDKGIEWAVYGSADINISPRMSMVGGIRLTTYQHLGPINTYRYQEIGPPTIENLIEPIRIDKKIATSYFHLQPRLSFRYRINGSSSIKSGYGRTVQYINQIYNQDTPTPASFWRLSSQYIKPQLSHNLSIGYFKNFDQNIWITSVEVFYRHIDQLFDFRDFADITTNDHLETEIILGIGRAYGAEIGIKKQVGSVHGWLNYTYSKAERKVDQINAGNWYPAPIDKPHDLSLGLNLQLNKRNLITFNFSYNTGRPITVPVSKHILENNHLVLNYSDRNALRIPDYHRLDISYNLAQGFRKSKKFKTSWTLSVYNVYSRRNAFSIYVEQNKAGQAEIKRLAVLGNAIPSLTFNFERL